MNAESLKIFSLKTLPKSIQHGKLGYTYPQNTLVC